MYTELKSMQLSSLACSGNFDSPAHAQEVYILTVCVCVCIQPAVLLSTMNTGAVCELIKQIDGIDTAMLPQYTAIIKKVGLLTHKSSACCC